jgi:replicative DNA helicase
VPQDQPAEIAALAAALKDGEAAVLVVERLTGDEFHKPAHRSVHIAIKELVRQQCAVDVVTVHSELERLNLIGQALGRPYLDELASATSDPGNVGDYIRRVRDAYDYRRLIKICQSATGAAMRKEKPPRELMLDYEGELLRISKERHAGGFTHVSQMGSKALEQAERAEALEEGLIGIPTGFSTLDEMLGGLQRGQMLVVAGRPGMGKSALGLDLARSAAKAGYTVGVVSLEMAGEALAMRVLSVESEVDSNRMRTGRLRADPPHEDWVALTGAASRINALPIYIDDSSAISLGTLRSRARQLQMDVGLDVLIVDYLQLMRAIRSDTRDQEIAALTTGLVDLFRELDVAGVVLSQLSRMVEKREDKRPMLSDLRESGMIEAAADAVLFPYCPTYYDHDKLRQAMERSKDNPAYGEEAYFHLEKHRHGPIGVIDVVFRRRLASFCELQGSEVFDDD